LSFALAGGTGFVSVDLDGLDAAFAPGVSAPNPLGLRVGDAMELAEAAGRDSRVRHFDLMELCPPHDLGARTARTAAYLFLAFVSGYQQRPR
jgi:formiminoglutamase